MNDQILPLRYSEDSDLFACNYLKPKEKRWARQKSAK